MKKTSQQNMQKRIEKWVILSTSFRALDKSSDMYNEQKELIETLAALAQSKSDSFALQIEKNIAEADTEFNKSLPVEAWISTEKQSHAIATEGATDLISQVAGQVKQFIQQDGQSDDQHTENIIDGIGGLLGSAVDVFLGAGQASDDLLERMCVYPTFPKWPAF